MTHSLRREMRNRLFERARSGLLTVAQLQEEFPLWTYRTIETFLKAEGIKPRSKTDDAKRLKAAMLKDAPNYTLEQLHKRYPYWSPDTVRVYVYLAGLKCIRKNAPCLKSPPSSSPR